MPSDQRLNLILTGNNRQLNQALESTTGEVQKMGAAFKEAGVVSAQSSKLSYVEYTKLREEVDLGFDSFRLFGKYVRQTKDELNANSAALGKFGEKALSATENMGKFSGKAEKVSHSMSELIGEFLESAEIIYRTGKAVNDFVNFIGEVPDKVGAATKSAEEFVATFEQNPFLQASARVENYEIKLKSLTQSGKQATDSIKFMFAESAKGGFRSESLLEAGVILKELNQDIEKTLPLAEKLAAQTGNSVSSAAVALGNAFEGLDTGFTQLQKTFHLTRDQLIQAGAATDEYGDISNRTTRDIIKNQEAITKSVTKNSSGVIEAQANTIQGSLNSFHETIDRVMEMVGDSMKRPVVSFIKDFTEVIHKGQDIARPFFDFMRDNAAAALSPVTISAKFAVAAIGSIEDSIVKVENKFGSLAGGVSLLTKSVLTGGLAFTGLATAMIPMIGMGLAVASAFVGVYGAANLIIRITSAIPGLGLAAKFILDPIASLSKEFATFSVRMALLPLKMAAVAGAFTLAAAAIYYVYQEQEKATAADNNYRNSLNKTINVSEKYKKLIGLTSQELMNSKSSSGAMSLALDSLKASYESAQQGLMSFNESQKEHKNTMDDLQSRGMGVVDSSEEKEENAKRKKDLEERVQSTKEILDKQGGALREATAKRIKIETDANLVGINLDKKTMDLEDQKIKFDQQRSRGVLSDKSKEAEELDKIYRSALDKRIAYDDEIAVLEEKLSQTKEDNPEFKKIQQTLIVKNMLRQKASEIEKNSVQEILQVNQQGAEYRLSKIRENTQKEIELGKKGSADQLSDLKKFVKDEADAQHARLGTRGKIQADLTAAIWNNDIKEIEINKKKLDEIDDQTKVSAEFQKKTNDEIEILAFKNAQEQKNLAVSLTEVQKQGISDRLAALDDEIAHGKNRQDDIKEETELIVKSNKITIDAIKSKLAIELESIAKSNPKARALAEQNAAAQIKTIQEEEARTVVQKSELSLHYLAKEIQNTSTLIEVRKQLLEVSGQALEVKYNHGENNAKEIEANKKLLEIKEIDIRESAKKIELLNNTDSKEVVGIQARAQADIDSIKNRYEMEASARAEANAVRTADRKVQIAEDAEKKISLDKLKYEASVQTGKDSSSGAFQKEQEFADKLLETHLKDLAAIRDAVKAHGNSVETARAEVEFTRASEEAKINRNKERTAAVAKERVSNADLAQKEVAEQKAILESKIETGQAGLNTAQKEKDAILSSLSAQEESIKARLAEQIASGDIADKARSQRDAQLQINQAIRDSEKALKDVNDKYKTGNSELDKETKKYQKILDALNKIKGKEEEDNDPDLKEPEEGGLYGNAIGGFSESVRKSNLERKKTESESRQKSISQDDARAAQAKSQQEVEFHRDQELSLKMRAEGKSQDEIRNAIFDSHKEVEGVNKSSKDKPGATPGTPNPAPGTPGTPEVNGPGAAPGSVPGASSGSSGGIGGGDQVVSLLTRIAVAVERSSGGTAQPQAKAPMANNGQGSFADPNPTDFVGKIMGDLSIGDSFKNDCFRLPGLGG